MTRIPEEAISRLTEEVKKLLRVEYSDADTDAELEGKVAACAESLVLGGTPAEDIMDCHPLAVETIRIMVLDLSEETPGFTKLSAAANYFALQRQLGVDGNG